MLFLIATGDYTGTSENHLSFTKGSRIEFIERTEGGFIKGKLNGKIGILPSSLITIETRPLSIITHSSKDEGSAGSTPTGTTPIHAGIESSLSSSSISLMTEAMVKGDASSVSGETTPMTTTTTTTSTPKLQEEEEDDDEDDSTDSENESKIVKQHLIGTSEGTSAVDGADIKSLSINSGTVDKNAITISSATQESEAKKEKGREREKKKKPGDSEGLFRKSKSGSSKKRRYANRKYLPNIAVSIYEDLPLEIRNDMQFEDISIDDIRANFKTFLTVVKFITRQRFTFVHPDKDNMTTTTTTTHVDENGITFTTTMVTTTTTVDNDSHEVVKKPQVREEIKTSTYDTDPFPQLDSIEEKDKKAKHVELKLERKRILTGTTAEFLGQASTTIKVLGDVKKKIKFGDMIGKGAFGKVYEAHFEKKKVAIKVVPYSNPKQQHAVLTEIGFLSKCKHPNILSYKGSVLYNSDLFLISEFIHGGTLEQAVTSTHVFKESQIGYIGKEILKAIEYLHDRKMVHRDLKSGNIMISMDCEVKIIDFGLCSSIEKGSHHHMVGSPYWMAPEMIRGENISTPADIWSFGICMVELLNKKPPHRDSRLKAMFTNTTKGIDFSKIKCSLEMKDMLWQCFHLNPEKRSSANKLLRHPFFKRAESKSGMKGIFDNMFLQKNLNTTGFFY